MTRKKHGQGKQSSTCWSSVFLVSFCSVFLLFLLFFLVAEEEEGLVDLARLDGRDGRDLGVEDEDETVRLRFLVVDGEESVLSTTSASDKRLFLRPDLRSLGPVSEEGFD